MAVCQYCGEKKNDLLQCAACGSVQYCDRSCQKSDWKSHKKNCKPYKAVCKPYKAVDLEGKGIGLLATKNIHSTMTRMILFIFLESSL